MWYTLRFSCAAQEGCRQSLHCDAEYRVNVVTVKKQASALCWGQYLESSRKKGECLLDIIILKYVI